MVSLHQVGSYHQTYFIQPSLKQNFFEKINLFICFFYQSCKRYDGALKSLTHLCQDLERMPSIKESFRHLLLKLWKNFSTYNKEIGGQIFGSRLKSFSRAWELPQINQFLVRPGTTIILICQCGVGLDLLEQQGRQQNTVN